MPTHKKARQLATQFEKVYPKSLPERLAWWCHVLGINHSRFLRLLGMSVAEANSLKNKSWETILQKKGWENNGWWVEGKLHELLKLFDYDWRALAERLHRGEQANGEELTRVTGPKGDIAKLPCVPSGDGTDILLNQIAAGGPQSLTALMTYLSGESLAPERSS